MKWYKRKNLHEDSESHQGSCWNPWCAERLKKKRAEVKDFPTLPQEHYHCWYCGVAMTSNGERRKSRDHVVPLSRGGEDHYKNIVFACQSCNGDKANLTRDEYRQVVAFRNGIDPKEFKFWKEISSLEKPPHL